MATGMRQHSTLSTLRASFSDDRGKRLNVVAILVSLLTPCAVFCGHLAKLFAHSLYFSQLQGAGFVLVGYLDLAKLGSGVFVALHLSGIWHLLPGMKRKYAETIDTRTKNQTPRQRSDLQRPQNFLAWFI